VQLISHICPTLGFLVLHLDVVNHRVPCHGAILENPITAVAVFIALRDNCPEIATSSPLRNSQKFPEIAKIPRNSLNPEIAQNWPEIAPALNFPPFF